MSELRQGENRGETCGGERPYQRRQAVSIVDTTSEGVVMSHDPLESRGAIDAGEADTTLLPEGDLIDLTAEEAAMHLVPEQRVSKAVRPRSKSERIELLEAQVTVLLSMARIHTEALQTLAEALERLPTEEPGDATHKINRAAHEAHDLLAALRGFG